MLRRILPTVDVIRPCVRRVSSSRTKRPSRNWPSSSNRQKHTRSLAYGLAGGACLLGGIVLGQVGEDIEDDQPSPSSVRLNHSLFNEHTQAWSRVERCRRLVRQRKASSVFLSVDFLAKISICIRFLYLTESVISFCFFSLPL